MYNLQVCLIFSAENSNITIVNDIIHEKCYGGISNLVVFCNLGNWNVTNYRIYLNHSGHIFANKIRDIPN